MTFQQSQRAYSQAVGTSTTRANLIMTRDPTSYDVDYELGTFWQNTENESLWYLNSKSSSGGLQQAVWINIEAAINSITVDASSPPGDNPVEAVAGTITVTGGQVATGIIGANVIRTDSLALGEYTIEIQQTAAAAAKNTTLNGVCHFNSAQFTVDEGFVSSIADTYYSLTPYIVGTDSHSQYSTIQSAITQAVADGAADATPANIYIKPDTYTENLTLPATGGINLICLDQDSATLFGSSSRSVILNGNISQSGSQNKIFGMHLTRTSGDIISMTGGVLTLISCSSSVVSGNFFSVTGTTTSQINLSTCNLSGDISSAFITQTGAAQVAIIDSGSQVSFKGVQSTFAAGASTITWDFNNCTYSLSITASTDSLTLQAFDSFWTNDGTNPFLTTSSSTEGSLQLNLTSLIQVSATDFVFGNSNFTLSTSFCDFQKEPVITYASSQQVGPSLSLDKSSTGGERFNGYRAGYDGSEWIRTQYFSHTTDATPTIIASISLDELQTIEIEGTIRAAKSDHTDGVWGNFAIGARRASGGNITQIGVPIINVQSDTTATFTAAVNVGTQTVDVIVTGIAATDYNWVCNYEYSKVLSDS